MNKFSISLLALSALAMDAHAAEKLKLFPGEIMGRDLALPGASWVGHVGLAMASRTDIEAHSVIEVMNENKVIQTNSVADFKSRSKYWGSRWDVIPHELFFTKARMLQRANELKSFCATYTLKTKWVDGVIGQDGRVFRCSVFRCDTFVNYLYNYVGYALPTFNSSLTIPLRVFNAFPQSNNDYLAVDDNHVDIQDAVEDIEDIGFEGTQEDLTRLINMHKSFATNSFDRIAAVQATQNIYMREGGTQELKEFYYNLMQAEVDHRELEAAIRGVIAMSTNEQIIQDKQLLRDSISKLIDFTKFLMLIDLVLIDDIADEFMPDLLKLIDTTDDIDIKEALKIRVKHRLKNLGIASIHDDLKKFIS